MKREHLLSLPEKVPSNENENDCNSKREEEEDNFLLVLLIEIESTTIIKKRNKQSIKFIFFYSFH